MKRFLLPVCGVFLAVSAYGATCNVGQFVDSGFCYSCPVNATCDDGEMFTCNDGFYRSGTICTACPVQNSTCTDAENFLCNAGTFMQDGACVACPPNATCVGGTELFHCDDGYYRNTTTNNACELCGDAAVCDNGERVKCGPGYRYYEPYGRCVVCDQGKYCPDGETLGCQEGYYFAWNSCYACSKNFFCPFLEATLNNQTQYCAAGYYRSMGTCVACDADTECPGGKPETMTCSDGLYLHSDGRCLGWPDAPGDAPDCNPGYYDGGDRCVSCPAGSVCSSESEFTCLAGHYKVDGKCNTCPSSATCNDADGILCDPGYYLKDNKCVQCPTSNYCNNNQMFDCPKYVPGMYDPDLDDGEYLYDDALYIAFPYPANNISQCRLYFGYINSPLGKYVRFNANWNTAKSKYKDGKKCWLETVTGYYLSTRQSCDSVRGYAYNLPCTNGPENSHYTGSGTIGGNDCPWVCDDGFYRDGDACVTCPPGENCLNGHVDCPAGMYADKNTCAQCPEFYRNNPDSGAEGINQCQKKCDAGTYVAAANATECTNVGAGYWAAENYTNYGAAGIRNKCPDNMTTIGFGIGADSADDCGKVMHIGNHLLYLGSVKLTSPALVVQYGDRLLYGAMSTEKRGHLRAEYAGRVYSIFNMDID